MRIKTGRLLWRTRGLHWDYLFLCIPDSVGTRSWYGTFCAVFGNLKPGPTPHYLRGTLRFQDPDQGEILQRFVACAAQDLLRTDWTRRPIQHFFVYCVELGDVPNAVPWFGPLLAGLEVPYEALFQFDREQVEQLTHAEVLRRFAALAPAETRIDGDGVGGEVAYTDLGTIDVEAKKKTAQAFDKIKFLRVVRAQFPGWVVSLGVGLVIGLLLRSCFTEDSSFSKDLAVSPEPQYVVPEEKTPRTPTLPSLQDSTTLQEQSKAQHQKDAANQKTLPQDASTGKESKEKTPRADTQKQLSPNTALTTTERSASDTRPNSSDTHSTGSPNASAVKQVKPSPK